MLGDVLKQPFMIIVIAWCLYFGCWGISCCKNCVSLRTHIICWEVGSLFQVFVLKCGPQVAGGVQEVVGRSLLEVLGWRWFAFCLRCLPGAGPHYVGGDWWELGSSLLEVIGGLWDTICYSFICRDIGHILLEVVGGNIATFCCRCFGWYGPHLGGDTFLFSHLSSLSALAWKATSPPTLFCRLTMMPTWQNKMAQLQSSIYTLTFEYIVKSELRWSSGEITVSM